MRLALGQWLRPRLRLSRMWLLAVLLWSLWSLLVSPSSATADAFNAPFLYGTVASRPTCDASHEGWFYGISNLASGTCASPAGGGTSYLACVCVSGAWTAATTGTGTGTVTSVTCGTGLTGGTITTTGTCAASFGSTSTTIAQGNSTTNGPNGTKYDPDRLTTSIYFDEECTGSLSGSWSWANQGTATDDIQNDSCLLHAPTTGSSTSAYRVRWVAAPSSGATDWVTTTRLAPRYDGATNQGGLLLLVTGTTTTPTLLVRFMVYRNGSNLWTMNWGSVTSYAEGAPITTFTDTSFGAFMMPPLCLQLRYIHSSKHASAFYSFDCRTWNQFGATQTLSADPPDIGRFVSSSSATIDAYVRYYWFRVRTDATGLAEPFPAGG